MKKSKFTEEQIAFALKQAESGTSIEEVCRKLGISQATFYAWRKKFGGLGVAELRRLRQRGTNRTGDPPPLKTACAAAAAVGVRGATRRGQRGPNSREPQA
jgi:transposase-like protein